MNINEIKYGFKLISVDEIKDINAKLYQYEHLHSGGKVAYIECDDTNCCFAIGFRTLPEDSTGVCHIIEHSTLCGSKKFPLKEPFVNLLKTSLSTFLNAFTAYDWTMYPFASQTPKDFNNILEIYCDAVFNPISMMDKKPFLQEGWHLELLKEEDTPSYKGVVYNEMKGAMSSADEVLVQTVNEAMYPDTFYRHNSGGEPADIPNLTYEAYKDFYHRHYTPQNAMTYFYGKMDIEEKLKFLDEEYFSKYAKAEDNIVIEKQAPVINTNYEKDYEIGPDDELKDNTHIALCYELGDYENNEEFLAFQILEDALLSKNDSPLTKALLDANLGQDVESRIDDDNIVTALHVYLKKTNHDKKEQFKTLFESEVRKLVENGIDKKLLLASINHAEFKDKELDTGRFAKGLVFAMSMMGSFNYRGDLKTHLEFSKYYDKFKKELNNNYFEKLLDKYILNSKHYVEVVINPSKELGPNKAKAMTEKMEALKNSMSKEEKQALVKQTQELLAYQNHVDTKAELKTLPGLKIRDIPSTINYLDSKKLKVNGMKGIYHILNTNKIAYLRMYFDMNTVTFDDLPYVLLLKNLLMNSPTNKYDVMELSNIAKTYLGDISFAEVTAAKNKDEYQAYFRVSVSSLLENINYIPDVVNEVLLHSKFNKKQTLLMLKQIVNGLKESIIGDGMSVAMSMVNSHYSKEAALRAKGMSGPKVYEALNNLVNNYQFAEINKKLKGICQKLFNKKNVFITLSGDEETVATLKKEVSNIKLPRKSYDKVLDVVVENPTNEALIIPSSVSYNAMGNNLANFNMKYDGKYAVLSHIVLYDYLWSEIRVKGGAYGCRLFVTQSGGITFGSFRDPNVKNSYAIYKALPEYLKKFKVSKDEFTSYIIGAMGGFDAPQSNPSLINSWDINYLTGYSKKDIMAVKKQILSTKMSDINDAAALFENVANNSCRYTVGNEDKIKEYNDFDVIKNLA